MTDALTITSEERAEMRAKIAQAFPRRYFEEGTEVHAGHIIEDSGWYVLIFGEWCYDEESQE